MEDIVIISGHPNLEQSNANKTILQEVEKLLPNAKIRRLDTLYPNYQIDLVAEREVLEKADVIVLQFPFYWFSYPALLKKWVDEVYMGFAIAVPVSKIKGKKFIFSFTAGAPESAYDYQGYESYPIDDFLNNFRSTAKLCAVELGDFVYSFDMHLRSEEDLAEIHRKAKDHALRLVEAIKKGS